MPTVAKKKAKAPIVTFEQMHSEYERRHGVRIDVAAEAAKLARRRKPVARPAKASEGLRSRR